MKVLALDYGSARTGVAVSDPTGTLARPLEVVENASAPRRPEASRRAGRARRGRADRRRPARDVARRAGSAGRGDRGIRVRSQGGDRGADRELRRAVHDQARRGAAVGGSFRCASPRPTCFRPTWNGRAPSRDKTPPAGVLHDTRARGSRRADPRDRRARRDRVCGRRPRQRRELGPGYAGHDDTARRPSPSCASSSRRASPASRWRDRITAVNKIAEDKRQITPNLSEQEYLRVTKTTDPPAGFPKNVPNLEGFLFPATYDFTEDTTSKELVGDQLEAFDRNWSQIDLKYAKSKNLTPYDVLIIASMIEKEVQVPKERPLVAAVIYNRLHLGMPLGIDATIRYGFEHPADASDPAEPAGRPPRRTTLAAARESRRPRSATRGLPRCRRPRTRRRSTTCTSSARQTARATSSRRASTSSTTTRAADSTAVDHRRRHDGSWV